MSQAVLETILGHHLEAYYNNRDTEEIAINRPGELWQRLHRPADDGRLWIRHDVPEINRGYLTHVFQSIANITNQPFAPFNPGMPCTLNASLSELDHRFFGIMGPSVTWGSIEPAGGVALNIRKGADAARSFHVDYADWGLEYGKGVGTAHHQGIKIRDPRKDALGALMDVIAGHYNVLISGATSTGKTTLFKRMMSELNPRTRIVTVEDTRELKLPDHPNHVHLMVSRTSEKAWFTYDRAIDAVKRMTPDLVLVGEVSSTNGDGIWKLTGTGHGAMMCTIHAESVLHCEDKFYEILSDTATADISRESVVKRLREEFCIIQIGRDERGKRAVTDMRIPTGRPELRNEAA